MADSSKDFGTRSFGTASGSPGLSSGTSGFQTGSSGAGTGSTDLSSDSDMHEETSGGVRERFSEATSQAREKLSDAASQARERVSGMTNQARDMMSGQVQHMREMDWQGLSDNAMNYARQNPGQAMLISVGFGFMLGLLLRPSR